MKNSYKIKKIVMITILSCLAVVLQLFSNYVPIGTVNITLALIPIVVGAILYGPLAGFIIGAVCGFVVFVAPATISLFWEVSVLLTFVLCILKMGIAGMVSGYIYKWLKNKNVKVAVLCSSVSVPLINTGIFAIGAYLFYYDLLVRLAPAGQEILVFLFVGFIGGNFLIELFVNTVLSPVILRLVNIATEHFFLTEEEK